MFFSRINAAVKFSAEQDREQEPENEIDKKEKKEEMKSSIMKAAQKVKKENAHIRSLDPTGRRTPFRQYVIACQHADHIVQTETFNNIIFLAILTAGILVGAQTYPSLDDNKVINILDIFILALFSIEVILKIMGEGMDPLRYFIGDEWHWNCFDFCIVLLSMPFLPFGSGIAFLRLIRLMRLAKVFRKVPQLRMIMTGLIGGLKSIVYIVILLLLVFYLYAIAGIFFFRGNDPWHFRSIAISLTSLFRLATLSNWADMFYINYYGCSGYSGGLYYNDPDDVDDGIEDIMGRLGAPMHCQHHNPQPWLSMAYFVSFIFICSFSMLSLFVGAITVSMSESMQTMKIEKVKQKKLKKLKNAEKKLDTAKNADRRHRRSWALVEMAFSHGKVEVVDEDNSRNHKLVQCYKWLSKKCEQLAENTLFQNFITLVIILAGVQVGMSTDEDVSRELRKELYLTDAIIRIIFTVEVVVKIVAEELTPWMYFENNWNTFDFIVVIGSYVSGGGSIIVMLRLLRLLRVLKLMRMLPQLQVIVSALMSGFSSITFISIILILFFYFFGIIAMILFGANDPWHFGTLHMTMIVLFQCSTLDNWTDILYINLYGCDVIGYDSIAEQCDNPQVNFLITSVYFIVFILMGALVLLTLFIGVVATSMEEATDEQKAAESVETRVADIAKDNDLDNHRITLYREVFDALDLNGGNSIDANELRLGMKAAGRNDITDEQFRKLWKAVDNDNSGGIDFAEFLSFMMSLRKTRVARLEKNLADHANGEQEENKDVIESNMLTVAEQLYNAASSIGPLDSSVKMKELVKKTSMGRPNSAPRALNRLYSLEHSIFSPVEGKDYGRESPPNRVNSSTFKSLKAEEKDGNLESKPDDDVQLFDSKVGSDKISGKEPSSAAKYRALDTDEDQSVDTAVTSKPRSRQGSARGLQMFSRDVKIVPAGAEPDVSSSGAFNKVPGNEQKETSHHQVPGSPGGKKGSHPNSAGKTPSHQPSNSTHPWANTADSDADDRAAQFSAPNSKYMQQQHPSPLNFGDSVGSQYGSTPSKSPSRQRPGKTKKVVSKICFV